MRLTRRGENLAIWASIVALFILIGLACGFGGRLQQGRLCDNARQQNSAYLLKYYHCDER